MVSGYDDSGAVKWLEGKGIDLIRGTGRIAGAGKVAVDDEIYEADQIVIATGSDPVVPPIPGLRELEGVWTNREATGLKEVPRRLLVLGAGPVGVEMAQAVARMAGSVASSRAWTTSSRASLPRSAMRSERCSKRTGYRLAPDDCEVESLRK